MFHATDKADSIPVEVIPLNYTKKKGVKFNSAYIHINKGWNEVESQRYTKGFSHFYKALGLFRKKIIQRDIS